MADIKKYTTITIPFQLADKIKERIKNTGFNSVSSYIIYVMRQVLSNIEKKETESETKEAFSAEDEEKVKKRLKNLGYL